MDTINARLRRAVDESEFMDKYDYLLINDDLDECVEKLHQIIQSEHNSTKRNIERIKNIRKDIEIFSEGE